MKLLSVVTALALAVATTHAAPCTIAESEAASTKPELLAANAKCYALQTDTTSTTPKTDAENRATCEKNRDCINALTAAVTAMPDCTFNGDNLRDVFKKNQMSLVEKCQKLGVQVSGAAGVRASAAMATAAVAVAAVMVVLV